MQRRELLLAALASAGHEASLTPVKVQKLFFLLDREMAHLTEGPHFRFAAYDYGPFDRGVYDAIDDLKNDGLVHIDESGPYRRYSLTANGMTEGMVALRKAPAPLQRYMTAVSEWLKRVTFAQLVSEIYKQYPEMKANSIFKQ